MSFNYSGFVKDNIEDIIARLANNMMIAIPDLNLDPSNPIYQLLKAYSLEELRIQNYLEQSFANMTVMGASGVFLNSHAIEAGLFRKQATNANGYVQCVGDSNDYEIPEDSIFATQNAVKYLSYQSRTFSSIIPLTRGTGDTDSIPSTYYQNVLASGIYQDINLTIPFESGVDYEYADDYITWLDTGAIEYGTPYWLDVSGTMTVNVPIVSLIAGTSGNTGPNTIIYNTNGLSIDSVNNAEGLTNAVDIEDDETLRYRILRARRKTYSLERMNDMILEVDGVKDSRTYQTTAVDRTNLDDWNQITGFTGSEYEQLLDTQDYGFMFYPSTGIGTFQGFTLHGRVTGLADPLQVYMVYHSSGTYITGQDAWLVNTTIDRGILSRGVEDTFQDIYVSLPFNGLDYTKTYRINIAPTSTADTNNCWEICFDTGFAVDDYRLDYHSGLEQWLGTGFIRKTHYGQPAVNASVVVEDGYLFDDLTGQINDLFDYIDGGGNSPICIQTNILEAVRTYLGVSTKIYIDYDYTFDDVTTRLKANVDNYLSTLKPGEDVIYSQIEKQMLNTIGVSKVRQLQININGGTWSSNLNEFDIPVGSNEYVRLDTGGTYSGVTILEG